MATAVLIPWAGSCPHRQAALDWVTHRYRRDHPDWEIILGTFEGPWCKALAVDRALAQTDADRLVIADADVWSDDIGEAVDRLDDHPWARPHHDVHRLTPQATDSLLAGGVERGTDPLPYHGVDGGGIVAIRREVYEDVPLDPRFVGWGGEDHAWGFALCVLLDDPWRSQAPLLHLWHPPQPDASKRRGPGGQRFMNDRNKQLLEDYKHARPNPPALRRLVDEAREALHGERQGGPQPAGSEGTVAVA